MADAPDFVAGRELVGRAYDHAYRAHCGPDSTDDTTIEHPVAVARLLDEAGFGDEVVAAALLHDVVEDTTEGIDSIRDAFGEEVTGYVEAMTEDAGIDSYEERKDEHRRRVLAAGAGPASIYAADKLARVRAYAASGDEVEDRRLDHYWDTLQLFASRRPELPFLSELAAELPELEPGEEEPGAGDPGPKPGRTTSRRAPSPSAARRPSSSPDRSSRELHPWQAGAVARVLRRRWRARARWARSRRGSGRGRP